MSGYDFTFRFQIARRTGAASVGRGSYRPSATCVVTCEGRLASPADVGAFLFLISIQTSDTETTKTNTRRPSHQLRNSHYYAQLTLATAAAGFPFPVAGPSIALEARDYVRWCPLTFRLNPFRCYSACCVQECSVCDCDSRSRRSDQRF